MQSPIPPRALDLDPERLWVLHCADGPVPRAAAAAVRAILEAEVRPWELRWAEDHQSIPREARTEAARLLAVEVDDISLTANTSAGLVAVAFGFPWRNGDEVVAPLGEFPANSWPWRALRQRGVGLREVPLWEGHLTGADAWRSSPPTTAADPEQRLLDALSPRTRILAVSWVRFQDGLRLDLPRLAAGCGERGVHLVVDGIQGAGTHSVPLAGCAAFAAGGHKGLLAPQGLGLLWTAPAFRQLLMPSGTWLSVEQADDFSRPSTDGERDWLTDGRRLEPGSPNLVGAAALRESLRLINRAGPATIQAHVEGLQRRLLGALGEGPRWSGEAQRNRALLEHDRLGPFLALHHGGLGADALDRLRRSGSARGIYTSAREGYLRLAFHGWHTEDDVEKLATWLAAAPSHQ